MTNIPYVFSDIQRVSMMMCQWRKIIMPQISWHCGFRFRFRFRFLVFGFLNVAVVSIVFMVVDAAKFSSIALICIIWQRQATISCCRVYTKQVEYMLPCCCCCCCDVLSIKQSFHYFAGSHSKPIFCQLYSGQLSGSDPNTILPTWLDMDVANIQASS